MPTSYQAVLKCVQLCQSMSKCAKLCTAMPNNQDKFNFSG